MKLRYLKSSLPMLDTRTAKPREDRQSTRLLHTGSKAWQTIRKRVLLRDLYTCQLCGADGDQVDHKDGDSHNNQDANLQTLCINCHSTKTATETNGKRWAT